MKKKLELLSTLESIFRGETKIDEIRTVVRDTEGTLELIVKDKVICITVDEADEPEYAGQVYIVDDVQEGELLEQDFANALHQKVPPDGKYLT